MMMFEAVNIDQWYSGAFSLSPATQCNVEAALNQLAVCKQIHRTFRSRQDIEMGQVIAAAELLVDLIARV
jgi:hypothetical protein